MITENKKPVYIMSLEASDVYYHIHREEKIKKEYFGMIPFSLELLKLKSLNMSIKHNKDKDKFTSDDIININFETKVRSAEELYKITNNKIIELENSIAKQEKEKKDTVKSKRYLEYLQNFLEECELHMGKDSDWKEVSTDNIRKELYENGFTLKETTASGKIKETHYVVYKRSSAKSRTGQCLFIKKELCNRMIKWSRMNLPFKKNQKIDLASLLAYESLVGSSLESTIEIDSSKILIVDDVDSRFKKIANIVRKNESTGFLDSFTDTEYEVVNSIFDGQSMLDAKYFKNGQGMMLLRNHMFKSASFNTNLQEFFKSNKPDGIEYDDWYLEDMYGNKKLAKDIDMVITPNSLKALKFKDVFKLPAEEIKILETVYDKEDLKDAVSKRKESMMWDYWIELVNEEGNIFGVCKHEKSSKIGNNLSGKMLQQTSYQMINCLPINQKDIQSLLKTEERYISKIQNDDEFLLQELIKDKDETNANEVIVYLSKNVEGFTGTETFKNFKKIFIYNKRNHAKKGKIKIQGDYSVLFGNPMEFLFHTIGDKKILELDYNLELKNNEIYCSMFDDGENLVGFRNPNTSPSNVLFAKNKHSENINKYFNLTDNIVAVNSIRFDLLNLLSGADFDSDTMLISNDETMVNIGEKCFNKYTVCVNEIKGDKKEYRLNTSDHCTIDTQLSQSQKIIGRVVNLGQFCMSVYWDLLNNGKSEEELKELLKKVDVMTILSGIAIDMAKKFYDLEMMSEILHVEKNELLKKKSKKPMFWQYVSQNKKIKENIEEYKCPMDFLIDEINSLNDAKSVQTVDFEDLLESFSTQHVYMKQLEKIKEIISDYNVELQSIKSMRSTSKRMKIIDLDKDLANTIGKMKVKADVISILLRDSSNENKKILLNLLKIMYDCHKDEFKKAFKMSKNGDFSA